MWRRLPVLLVSAATVVSLAACGSDSSPAESESASTPPSSSSASTASTSFESVPESEALTPSSSAAAPAAAPVTVNKTITDPELGNTYQVLRYIDGYQPSAESKEKYSTVRDGKVVLVEVKVTAGTKYSGRAGDGDFRLTKTANGIDKVTTSILDDDVTKAGYAPLEDARRGTSSTGWLVFVADAEQSTLVLRVKRLAYKIIGGGSIAAKTWDLPLN